MKDEILAYAQGEAYPFHMPGHKRNIKDGVFPYQLDLTEIDGFDNLHHPEGYIKQIEDKAAEIYRAKRAFLLVNGATCGILAAIKAATMRGDKVIIARNCHTSVFHAVELLGLKPEFIMPERAASDIFGCVNPVKLEKLLSDNPDAKLVVITSPTYEGICSDVDSIAGICREKGVKLFVDEAHGAHFPFHDDFPNSAICCGADISVVSLHKTMPAMTQTALLLTGDSEVIQPLQTALSIFQTSSPSYVLMSSIETCLTTKWDFDSYIKRIRKLEAAAADMKRLKLLFRDKRDFSYDIGKLVISTQKANISGIELAEILRKKYKIEVEMAAYGYIIAMTSVCDTDEGFERLIRALLEIDSSCKAPDGKNELESVFSLPERRLFPFEVVATRTIQFCDAQGFVTAEDIFAYPPGIPIIVKGEVLSPEIIGLVNRLYKNGVNVISSEASFPGSILVADL